MEYIFSTSSKMDCQDWQQELQEGESIYLLEHLLLKYLNWKASTLIYTYSGLFPNIPNYIHMYVHKL